MTITRVLVYIEAVSIVLIYKIIAILYIIFVNFYTVYIAGMKVGKRRVLLFQLLTQVCLEHWHVLYIVQQQLHVFVMPIYILLWTQQIGVD